MVFSFFLIVFSKGLFERVKFQPLDTALEPVSEFSRKFFFYESEIVQNSAIRLL